jgi:5-methyltetrahydrofolate--homocysteine methyltransferase
MRTMMGVTPSQVVQTFQPLGVTAIGANCGTTLENMEAIVKEYSATVAGLVIWAKPNAGLPSLGDDGTATYNVTPEQMGEFANRYIQAGARIIGGCCGSTPAHVAGIARTVKKAK